MESLSEKCVVMRGKEAYTVVLRAYVTPCPAYSLGNYESRDMPFYTKDTRGKFVQSIGEVQICLYLLRIGSRLIQILKHGVCL